ncbi:MAG: hypothetical protein NTU88_03115, partial [Armatimonadetes bacterium]|nr:hypothetical protein [Armatimonadota bacterium]
MIVTRLERLRGELAARELDGFLVKQSAAECPGMILELVESHWVPGAQRSIGKHDLQRIGFETHQLSYHDWSVLSTVLSPRSLVPEEDLVGKLRLVKDEMEIAAIREAVRIADLAYGHIVEFLKPGLPEREIAIELD